MIIVIIFITKSATQREDGNTRTRGIWPRTLSVPLLTWFSVLKFYPFPNCPSQNNQNIHKYNNIQSCMPQHDMEEIIS